MKLYLPIYCLLSCFVCTTGPQIILAQDKDLSAQVPIALAGDDRVHFGDVIDVDIVGGFEFDWRGTVTSEGFLDGMDAYTEPIYALCRSEGEIAAQITKLLGRTLRDPKVVVRIIDRSNRAVVRLDGAVRTATRFQLRRPVRLRELIIMAGGLIDGASGEIGIFRPKDLSCRSAAIPGAATTPQDNQLSVTNIKIVDLLSGKSEADLQILSGDIITVNRALPIYVIGAVVNPRPVYSREKITLSRLIASAGGLAKEADGGRVYIFRRTGVEVKSIESDLEKIKKGETNDEILQPFDIIEVAAKGGSKRRYPPVTANDQIVDRSRQNPPLRIVD